MHAIWWPCGSHWVVCLVDMSETAHILHHATPRSLLILDEIGTGTSTSEGLDIAWAVALYIVRRLGARSLFASHCHELTALEALSSHMQNFHLAIDETCAVIRPAPQHVAAVIADFIMGRTVDASREVGVS